MLAEEEPRDERRRSGRSSVYLEATLRAGELTIDGIIRDCSAGGVFFATQLLIEVGERGVLLIDDISAPVQVVWLRGNAHGLGPGMGLCFEDGAEHAEAIAALLGRAE